MKRWARQAAAALAALLLAAPSPAPASGTAGQEGHSQRVDVEIELDAPAWLEWALRLEQEVARMEAARRRVRAAEQAWTLALHRKRPRGEARAKLRRELEEARAELERLEREAPVLLEEARRAGVPAGILQRYEEALGVS